MMSLWNIWRTTWFGHLMRICCGHQSSSAIVSRNHSHAAGHALNCFVVSSIHCNIVGCEENETKLMIKIDPAMFLSLQFKNTFVYRFTIFQIQLPDLKTKLYSILRGFSISLPGYMITNLLLEESTNVPFLAI